MNNLLAVARAEAGRPLIATHRGTAAGCIFPNTAAAAHLALASGSDIVELDAVRTLDGEYFTFHDGYEPVLLHSDRGIEQMTRQQALAQRYGKFQGSAGVSALEAYRDVLAELPATFVNVDRSFRYWKAGFLTELATWADPRYMLVKSTVADEYLTALAECGTPFPYIPIVSGVEEVERVLAWEGINVIGLEVLASSAEDRLADAGYMAELKQRGLLLWFNAINLENGRPLYRGWDDLASIDRGPDHGWGKLVAQGADVIQTDYPWLLRPYLDALGADDE